MTSAGAPRQTGANLMVQRWLVRAIGSAVLLIAGSAWLVRNEQPFLPAFVVQTLAGFAFSALILASVALGFIVGGWVGKLNGVLGAHGYEIVRFCHMRGKSPASYSVLTAQDMIKAARSIDGPDVEAIVAFGANLPFAKLADEAERWLNKPVLQINATTYWHALRTNAITDKIYGYGSLLSHF